MKKSSGVMRLLSLREVNDAKGEQYRQERDKFLNIDKPQIITGFNLFQTPQIIAAKMIDMAGDLENKSILEPSAGLGRIIEQIPQEYHKNITAYDINNECIGYIYKTFDLINNIRQQDFLEVREGTFDIVCMNPPFKQGQDIKHIKHAYSLLNSGGELIALCYNGVRQSKQLKPIADYWEILPDKSFKESGTNASVALLKIIKG